MPYPFIKPIDIKKAKKPEIKFLPSRGFSDTKRSKSKDFEKDNAQNNLKNLDLKDFVELKKQKDYKDRRNSILKKLQKQREAGFQRANHDHIFKPSLTVKTKEKPIFLNGKDNPLLEKIVFKRKPAVADVVKGNYLKEVVNKVDSTPKLKSFLFRDFSKKKLNIIKEKKEPVKGVMHNDWRTNPPQSVVEARVLRKAAEAYKRDYKLKNDHELMDKAFMIQQRRAEKKDENLINSTRNHKANTSNGLKIFKPQHLNNELGLTQTYSSMFSKAPRFKSDSALSTSRSSKS